MGAATILKSQNPSSKVVVRDLQPGQLTVLPTTQQQSQRYLLANTSAGALVMRPRTRPSISSAVRPAVDGWIA